MFHYLEENIEINNQLDVLIESIKCHQISFTEYFLNNYFSDQILKRFIKIITKYYDLRLIGKIIDDSFYYLCKYDYSEIVEILVKSEKSDSYINKINISKFAFMAFFTNL